MKKIVLTMMMLAAAGIGALQAQNNFSLRLGVALPTGDYADATADYANDVLRYGLIDNTKKGGAGKGITAGMQYKIGINSVKGLGVVLSADVFFNSVNTCNQNLAPSAPSPAQMPRMSRSPFVVTPITT